MRPDPRDYEIRIWYSAEKRIVCLVPRSSNGLASWRMGTRGRQQLGKFNSRSKARSKLQPNKASNPPRQRWPTFLIGLPRQSDSVERMERLNGATWPVGRDHDWAERAMMDAEFDEADTDVLTDIVGRLGLADVAEFGLRWQDCEEFLRRLGYRAKVIVSSE